MTYDKLLLELNACAESAFADFQRKLILPPKQNILGVRTPTLRKIAKKYLSEIDDVFAFPDEYYEVTFIKLTMAAHLPYEQFVTYLDRCVGLIDNWALCDSFKAPCVASRKREFLPVIERYFATGEEFYQRYALVMLLFYYVEEEYVDVLISFLRKADRSKYYVYMACAWLTVEILIKHYDVGVSILQHNVLDVKTHNKSIQKAQESFRLNDEQKRYLKTLKIS